MMDVMDAVISGCMLQFKKSERDVTKTSEQLLNQRAKVHKVSLEGLSADSF